MLSNVMSLASKEAIFRDRVKTGKITVEKFPDGESYHRLDEKVEDENIVIIGGTITDEETMELFDLGCAMSLGGAKTLTIIIPYYGYSTMERGVKPGEIVKAKTRALLLSSIPQTTRNKIVFMDLHSEGIPYYLEGNTKQDHIYTKELIMKMCKDAGGDDFVLGSTDAGRAKWVESLANEMGVQCAIITKRRLSGSKTEISNINADVKGKKVVIYDDMIRTGGSLIGAAEAYKAAGAEEVYAVATHGVLPSVAKSPKLLAKYSNDIVFKLFESKAFNKIFVTNTHPTAINAEMPGYQEFFNVYDVSILILKNLFGLSGQKLNLQSKMFQSKIRPKIRTTFNYVKSGNRS